jgi:hypothetical protein
MANSAFLSPMRSLQCKTGAGEDQGGLVSTFSLLGKCNKKGICTEHERDVQPCSPNCALGLEWMPQSWQVKVKVRKRCKWNHKRLACHCCCGGVGRNWVARTEPYLKRTVRHYVSGLSRCCDKITAKKQCTWRRLCFILQFEGRWFMARERWQL